MKVYKGTDKNMQCRGFQYEHGKEYVEGRAELCEAGFHACEAPLDVFKYYAPADSRYFEAELGDISDERSSNDTKIVGRRIKLGAEIGIHGIVKAQFEYVKENTTEDHTDPKAANAGDCGAANAGYRGAANAGNYGAANAGDCGAANAGDCGAANAGNCGAANAGNYGAANAGNRGAATSRGASSVGKYGIAIARGNGVKVKGALCSILLIAEENDSNYEIKDWAAAVVDGETIKADTWYTLKNGEFVEVEEFEETDRNLNGYGSTGL
jgi:hypothetical protein